MGRIVGSYGSRSKPSSSTACQSSMLVSLHLGAPLEGRCLPHQRCLERTWLHEDQRPRQRGRFSVRRLGSDMLERGLEASVCQLPCSLYQVLCGSGCASDTSRLP